MAPILSRRRALSSSLPTLLSFSRLFQAIPSALHASYQHSKRDSYPFQSFDQHNHHHNSTTSHPIIDPEDPPDSPVFWWKLGLSVCLVLLGGVFAGSAVLRNLL